MKGKLIEYAIRWLAGGIMREVADGRRGPRALAAYQFMLGKKTATGWILAVVLAAIAAFDPQLALKIAPALATASGLFMAWGFLDRDWRTSEPPAWVGEGFHTLVSLGPVLALITDLLVRYLSGAGCAGCGEWAHRIDLAAGSVAMATAWLATRLARPPLQLEP